MARPDRGARPLRDRCPVLLLLLLLAVIPSGCADAAPRPGPDEGAVETTGARPDVGVSVGGSDGGPDAGSGEGSGESPGGAPPPESEPPETPPPVVGPEAPEPVAPPVRPGLQSFIDDCERGVREWRAGQVSYPEEVTVEVGGTTSYVAAVDIRDSPAPPSDVITGQSPTGEEVYVRCEIAARLTPLGDALTVEEEGWVLRSFTPTGVIRWTWAVTAVEASDQDLRLELQPAVRSEDGTVVVSDTSTDVSSFVTRARVEQGSLAQMGEWWTENWGTVTLVSAGLGAALLALLKYGAEFAGQFRRVVDAWGGDTPEHEAEQEPETEADEGEDARAGPGDRSG